MGARCEEGTLRRFIGPPLYVSFHEFYGLSDEDSFEAIRVYREYYESEGVYQAPLFAGISEMLIDVRNQRSVDTSTFDCDYYRFVKKSGEADYRGEYMTGYDWAQNTRNYLNRLAAEL